MENRPLQIQIDSRVRVPVAMLSDHERSSLADLCTHENPARGEPGEPEFIRTWRLEGEWLTLPRGSYRRVAEWASANRFAVTVDDRRATGAYMGDFIYDMPDHRVKLWDFQERAVQSALVRQNCIVRAPTGCVTGDAMIGTNRGGIGRSFRLDYVVEMFNGGRSSGKTWRADIPTMVSAPMPNGTVRLAKLVDAKDSGVKPVYTLTTECGLCVTATEDHPILSLGAWAMLGTLRVGDFVSVNTMRGRPSAKGLKKKPWYKLVTLREHPFVGRKGVCAAKGGWTVPVHRLVAEARLNGVGYEEFLALVREHAPGLSFLDP
jgi:hypothetical protein